MPDPGPIPVQFGPYRIRESLGEGSFARVYRAEFQGPWNFRKEVALKVVHHRISAANERFFRSLVNEARLGGLLKHPNIIEVYECGQVGDRCYIAMEYVDGVSLREVVARAGKLPRGAVLDIGIQGCRGLHHAHQVSQGGRALDLVHRDVKPDNFMISRHDLLKIMDFGIAKARLNAYQTAPGGITRGTPLYMSPEQIAGGDLTRRSDIFALGAVLGELACGRPIFEDDNLMAILNRALRCDVEPGLARVEAAFPDLVPILRRCLSKEPGDRQPTAEALAAELTALKPRHPWGGRLSSLLAGLSPAHVDLDLLDAPERDDLAAARSTRAFFSTLPHMEAPAGGPMELDVDPAGTRTIEQLAAMRPAPTLPEISLELPQLPDLTLEDVSEVAAAAVARVAAPARPHAPGARKGGAAGEAPAALPPPLFLPDPEDEEQDPQGGPDFADPRPPSPPQGEVSSPPPPVEDEAPPARDDIDGGEAEAPIPGPAPSFPGTAGPPGGGAGRAPAPGPGDRYPIPSPPLPRIAPPPPRPPDPPAAGTPLGRPTEPVTAAEAEAEWARAWDGAPAEPPRRVGDLTDRILLAGVAVLVSALVVTFFTMSWILEPAAPSGRVGEAGVRPPAPSPLRPTEAPEPAVVRFGPEVRVEGPGVAWGHRPVESAPRDGAVLLTVTLHQGGPARGTVHARPRGATAWSRIEMMAGSGGTLLAALPLSGWVPPDVQEVEYWIDVSRPDDAPRGSFGRDSRPLRFRVP
ncbi:serine/threonine protein kinase [Myxococcota bacterium]|nr:serine/threonine protein kinase [Myxococcota bacterium]